MIYAAVFRVFGESVRTANSTVLILGFGLTIVCYLLAKSLMDSVMALLTSLIFILLPYSDEFDGTHHWFSTLLIMVAILLLFSGRSNLRIVMAAIMIGIATFFTQTAGAMALTTCAASFICERWIVEVQWKHLALRLFLLFVGAASSWYLLSRHFILVAGWHRYWYFQVVYPERYVKLPEGFLYLGFAPFHGPRATLAFLEHLWAYLVLLLVYPCLLLFLVRRRRFLSSQTMPLILLAFMGSGLMLEVITRLNWNRINAAIMPALIIGMWMLNHIRARRLIIPLCWCLLICLAAGLTVSAQHMHHQCIVHLPTGAVLLPEDRAEEAKWIAQHTSPGDEFFDVGDVRFYLALQLSEPGPVDMFYTSEITRPEWVLETISLLERDHVRYLLWEPTRALQNVDDKPASEADHLGPMREFVRAHFIRIKTFRNKDQIWERLDDHHHL